ncbi:hypothetical protein KPATCC21470_0290 [Kitasatospora purpeofusca]
MPTCHVADAEDPLTHRPRTGRRSAWPRQHHRPEADRARPHAPSPPVPGRRTAPPAVRAGP